MAISKLARCAMTLILACAMLAGCSGKKERQAEYLTRAQSYYKQGDYDKAKIEVKNVLQINPNNTEGLYLAGEIAEKDQNYQQAYSAYYNAVQADPKFTKGLNKLAEFYIGGNNLDSALDSINSALKVDPKNAQSKALLAIVYAKQKKIDDAIKIAQEALNLDPGNITATGVLATIYEKDNPDKALKIVNKGIASQKDNERLKVLKLNLLISQKKRKEAVALLKELIAEHPDKMVYSARLANYYLSDSSKSESERKDLAEAVLKQLVTAKPDEEQPKLWLSQFVYKNRGAEQGKELLKKYIGEYPKFDKLRDMLAVIYASEKDYASADALYQSVIDEDPTGASGISARIKIASLAQAQGQSDKVKSLLDEVFKLDPENTDALLMRAGIRYKENKLDDAIGDLRIVLKNDPKSKQALLMLAQAHQAGGEYDLALDSYKRLLALEPDNLAASVGAAKILIQKKQPDEALPLVENTAKLNAANPEVAKLLTDLYSRKKRWSDALSASAKLLGNEKTKALGYYLQGLVYLREKDFGKALDVFKESVKIEPAGVEPLAGIVASYEAMNHLDLAFEYVKDHVAKYPNQAHAEELLANLYAKRGNTDKAIDIAKKVIKESPTRFSAYTTLARLYAKKGQKDKIEQMYQDAIQKNPHGGILKVSLAELYQSMGKSDQAIGLYEDVLKSNPHAMIVKNNLASLLLDRDDKPETIKRAAQLTADFDNTEVPAFLDTAGWVQYKMGNYAQAVSLLAAAVQDGGNAPTYHYHLGMAYFKSKMPDQAKAELKLALKNDKINFVGKDEAQKVLKSL